VSRAAMFSLPLSGDGPYREYSNAWGGAAFIWGHLQRHLGWKEADWLFEVGKEGSRSLWNIAVREDIPIEDRVAMAITFDLCYIEAVDVPAIAQSLRRFVGKYGTQEKVCHLLTWADDMETMIQEGAQAIGFHHTSVGENPWVRYEGESDPIYLTPVEGYSVVTIVPEIRQEETPNADL